MQQGAIAFLDILGFKGIWQSRNPDEVLNILDNVTPQVIRTYNDNLKGQQIQFDMKSPAVTILSDTIVLAIESKDPKCLAILSSLVLDLFNYFSNHGLFFRGAISYGQFIQNGSTFIGPAIDDVAAWYEIADWIGVIATPKTSYQIDTFSALKLVLKDKNKAIPCFIKYHVPVNSKQQHFLLNSLNWPAYVETSFSGVPDGVCGTSKTMQRYFAKQAPFNSAVFQKFENTLQFVDFCYKTDDENVEPK